MSYESWRASFKCGEQAATFAYIALNKYKKALAWEIYCRETASSLYVRDSWDELPDHIQELYLIKAEDICSFT